MKKIIVLLTTILIIGLTFTSCAGKENESKNTVSEENITTQEAIVESTNEVSTNASVDEEKDETEKMETTEEIKETTAEEVMKDMLAQEAAKEMEENAGRKLPILSFKSVDFKAGRVKQGTQITHLYEFENTGEAPLQIENVKPSCGCYDRKFS